MTPRPKRFRDLEDLVRPEDRSKLAELDADFDRVREKHHPFSADPDEDRGFIDGLLYDDELEEP